MSTTKPTAKEVTAASHPDLPDRAGILGTDSAGQRHYYGNPILDHSIYVVCRDGETVAKLPLPDDVTVSNWMSYVDDTCGWDSVKHGEGLVERLARRLDQ